MSTVATTQPNLNGPYDRESLPYISEWLRSFQNRKSWLNFCQGVVLALLAFLAATTIVMLLDAGGVLSDGMRWLSTCLAYAVTLVLALAFGIASPWIPLRRTRLAHEVESLCPELREQLLACVELDTVTQAQRTFSEAFLNALEDRVAHALRERSIRELLPWSPVRFQAAALAISLLALASLFLFSSLDMPLRLQRAIFPFVEIERPSRTRIDVMKPQRSVSFVPENQAVELLIQLSGVDADTALVEWRTQSDSVTEVIQNQVMTRIGDAPSKFACTLPVATQEVAYRFRAGDGQTKWRTLRPTSRPRVTQFRHRIQFPAYTGLAAVDWHSDQGSINSLVGSKIELGLEPSIPLTSAQATIERLDTGDRETLPLTYATDRSVWRVARDCESDARFQFQLKARIEDSDESIENTYSPVHELNVVADHPPAAGWLATSKTLWRVPPLPGQAWIVAPEELIPLAAWIADDLPGAVLEQQISINRSPWKKVPVSISEQAETEEQNGTDARTAFPRDLISWKPIDGVGSPTESRMEWVWDVMTAGAASGDTVAVRVAVKDSLDQWSYSPTIEFSLASPGFERTRHDPLLARADLLPDLVRLAQFIHETREALQPQLQEARAGNIAAEDQARVTSELMERAATWIQICGELRSRAAASLPAIPRPLDQSETEYVVRLVSRLEREQASRLVEASIALSLKSSNHARLTNRIHEKIDAASQALQHADDHASRLVDIYRQFIGHETLTALTKDMMVFRDHEEEQLQRLDKMDFAMLARSQQIAQQYIDAIQSLARRMEPSVSQHLQNQFQDFYRFLDQTRSDLSHRSEQEPNSENFDLLAADVKRVYENLRHQHWVFHLDGGLWWNIADTRRDLIQRGSGLHTAMMQSIESVERLRTDLSEQPTESDLSQQLRSLASNIASIRAQNATMQMVDRKEFHQHRNPADPNFSRDMGLASRAWESQFDQWIDEPLERTQWQSLKETIQQVIKAYRVLEVAHEMQDVRFTAEYLRRQEQYDWRSMDGRLSHVRMWDSISHRIELIHQWMNDSGFPRSAADSYRAMLWSEPSNRIRQKMDPRRHANNELLVSASADIDDWMKELHESELQAAPTIEEARRFLASLAPSIPELAKRAANDAKALRENSRLENQPPIPAADLDQQSQRAERSIDRLEDALIENAMRQDILDPSELEIAKDSDRALRWISELDPPMRTATSELIEARQQAEDVTQMAEASERAVAQQSAMIDALDHIEQHFSMLEEPDRRSEDASETERLENSRARLQTESEKDRQPLASYDRADRIAEMANNSPEALLQQLESELKTNEPMQRELSQLSQDSVADAIQQLKKSAEDENSIAQQLENSDLERRGAKEREAQMLRHLGDSIDRMAVSMLEKSAEVVKRLNLPETRKSINQMAEDLRSVAREARNANPDQPASEISNRLSELLEQVEKAEEGLDSLVPRLQSKIESPSSKDNKQRQGQLTEMKSWQSLMRDDSLRRIREQTNELQQATNKAQRDAEARERELQQRIQNRQKLVDEFKAHPDRTWVGEELDRNTLETAKAAAVLANAQRLAESSKQLAEASESRVQAMESAQRANLDRPNPVAALADEQLNAAAREIKAISERLTTLAQSRDNSPNPSPSAQALSQASEDQDRIAERIDQVAQQIARSSRHEARLQNDEGSKQLAEQSQAIDQVAQNELTDAQQQLQSTAETSMQQQAEATSQARALMSPDQAATPPTDNTEANKAMQSTDAAAKALRSLAKQMEQVGAPKSSNDSRSSPQARSGAQQKPNANQSPQDMARLLDAIDQKLFGGGSQAQRSSSNPRNTAQEDSADAKSGERTPQSNDADDRSRSQPSSSKPSRGQSSSSERSSDGGSKEANSSEANQDGSMREAFRDAANEIAAQLQNERLARRQNASSSQRGGKNASSSRTGGQPDDSGRTANPSVGNSRLPAVPNLPGQDWGLLREQRAEDVTQGRRDAIDPEFSDAIRAYFRALGQRPN